MRIRSKFIGDRDFYKMVLMIAVPIMIQNGITNFVSLLDNIMIGQVGTEQMSGVAIVNQLIFVYIWNEFLPQYFLRGGLQMVLSDHAFNLPERRRALCAGRNRHGHRQARSGEGT